MPKLNKGVVLESFRHKIGDKGNLQIVVDDSNRKWVLVNDLKELFGAQFKQWYEAEKADLVEITFPVVKLGKSSDYWFIALESIRHILENPTSWYWKWLRSDD